ncbi:hypothetical protein M3205_23335 [Cytobacillus firmus]|uniref:hypothetical protein n=1 Tax=Cytobacillus TaxID=2675230 RepID=UPI000922AD82|nr:MULTISPECIES: hypothetical protein [Cytobacillus]MBU8733719.1 hypothetical protein [Cytobacillus oceanisediminis]MCM3708580.1 hypothetical protein [Cytobacillus firmus]MCS0827834.1 hypothetical protein [Cytobacillus firmus]SGI72109.1 Uncharacterised protein [Mycobacterium tuberculosis]
MNLDQISLIPKGYKNKDPRSLLYLYPNSVNIVAYAKKMQQFSFYQSLEIAEDLAKRQGFILLPWECIHWQRAKAFGVDRKVKIGRKSFFLMKVNELTKNERLKLENYLNEINQAV